MQNGEHAMFLMTSGLRSVRDKALTYFEDAVTQNDFAYDRIFKAVNLFAEQIRRVAQEDKEALQSSGLHFNMHALIGGQFPHDKEHKLYLVYPQGNWVEISEGTPYHILGASGYGKPVMDRTLKYHDSIRMALKVGCLAFDSTRISAADVDFPIDVCILVRNTFQVIEHRFEKDDIKQIASWWQERLRNSVAEIPADCLETVLSKLSPPPERTLPPHPH